MQDNLKPNTFLILFFAALAGAVSFFSFPVLLVLALAVCLICVFRREAKTPEEKKFITLVFCLATAIHILISMSILAYGRFSAVGSDFLGDAMNFESIGLYIKEFVSGIPVSSRLWGESLVTVQWLRDVWQGYDINLTNIYSIPSVSYWYGYLNILWGESFLAPKILNGLLWAIASFWIYLFFRDRFTARGIKFGLCLMLFYPTYMLISSSGLKDSLLFFLLTAIVFATHMLEKGGHRGFALLVLLSVLALQYLMNKMNINRCEFFATTVLLISVIAVLWNPRLWLFFGGVIIPASYLLNQLREYVLAVVLIFSFSILLRNISIKKIAVGFLIIFVFLTVVSGGKFLSDAYRRSSSALENSIWSLITQNYNTAYGATPYYIYPPKAYSMVGKANPMSLPELAVSYLNGLRYVFLEPTPWRFRAYHTVVMFPETLIIWFLIPFMALGAIMMLKMNRRMALVVILFLFIMTTILALGQGNMGTLVRTRIMVMIWCFMIAGIGLSAASHWIGRKKSNITGSSN